MSQDLAPAQPHPGNIWSIGWYEGPSPLALRPLPGISNPILTASDVTDIPAEFVADPFLLHHNDLWHLFFEIYHAGTKRGVIGLATSKDARSWAYQGVVLEENFHLSYPHVFAHEGEVYMTPETLYNGRVILYQAAPFPRCWRRKAVMVEGLGADPTVFRHGGLWWLFVGLPYHRYETLRLYHSEHFTGPWLEHLSSPITRGDSRRARPAGRVVEWEGRLLRFAQDCVPRYGTAVRAFEILDLTKDTYTERPSTPEVILAAGDQPWNAGRIHHVDAHQIEPGRWIASVDGTGSFS
jgi:hypothetical protein